MWELIKIIRHSKDGNKQRLAKFLFPVCVYFCLALPGWCWAKQNFFLLISVSSFHVQILGSHWNLSSYTWKKSILRFSQVKYWWILLQFWSFESWLISGVRVWVTRPNSTLFGCPNLAILKLITNYLTSSVIREYCPTNMRAAPPTTQKIMDVSTMMCGIMYLAKNRAANWPAAIEQKKIDVT